MIKLLKTLALFFIVLTCVFGVLGQLFSANPDGSIEKLDFMMYLTFIVVLFLWLKPLTGTLLARRPSATTDTEPPLKQ